MEYLVEVANLKAPGAIPLQVIKFSSSFNACKLNLRAFYTSQNLRGELKSF